ncbi:hypothetical protein F5J12DRAFT_889055 [Pisolithus orientalis]|uniref:uncharacterized protein n=1 Tax=Pisolithus orientalis TaxID=936130 RepID=UPI0022253E06|nr:uncharacterized protein F5J12DRAFT_889055 [Pisolithus orientalis]KAI6028533.1 hypothetical protein F5J12DRAFT_889055 [Pisolithus orientalis]
MKYNSGKKAECPLDSRLRALFTDAHDISERMVQEARFYADEIQRTLTHLEEFHRQKQGTHQVTVTRMEENDAPFKSLFSANPANLDKLVTQRRLVMETLEDDVRSQSTRMRKVRKRLLKTAERRSNEQREQQRLITDASIFIKHYKALIGA